MTTRYLGDVVSYVQTLVRLVIRAASPAPAPVLTMARTSDVRRRLDALDRRVFRSPLSRWHAWPAFCAGGVLLVLVSGFGFTRAGQNAAKSQGRTGQPAEASPAPETRQFPRAGAPAKLGRIVFRAVEAATNEPIDGASVEYHGRFGDKRREATVTTGEDGTAAIEWDAAAKVVDFWITARKPGLVPIRIQWESDRHPIQLPATKELHFEPGTTVGGIVKDESGRPIPGALVNVMAWVTESERKSYAFALASPQADAEGRWRIDVAPEDLTETWLDVTHPRYQRARGQVSRDLNSVTVLKKGLSVTGRVINAAGQPIEGARVVMGRDIWGTQAPKSTTDERGKFQLDRCTIGSTIFTVQAEGYAPHVHDMRVEERSPPVVVRMTEPGATLRARVVDAQGKPVAGAFVSADTWRGFRSIEFQGKTDKDGRFEWHSAPRDVVRYNIGKEGYMSGQRVPLTATDREQSAVLNPMLVIAGRVTDAADGRPVAKFRVVQGKRFEGQDHIYWSENQAADATGGRFTSQFGESGSALFVRIEAEGYKPADSRAFRPDEGQQTSDFALQRAKESSGIVLLPDGTPAAGVTVALATSENRAILTAGRFDRVANVPRFTTGTDGRFSFTPPDGKFLLIAVSDAGFAEASSDELTKRDRLVLQNWGRIEGGVRIGPRAGVDQPISYYPTSPGRGGNRFVMDYGYRTRTDERGRFAFDRVVPGTGIVARMVVTRFPGDGVRYTPCWQEAVEVRPGRAIDVKLGGRGRPVIGRLVLEGAPELSVDWTRNAPAEMQPVAEERARFAVRNYQLAANIDKDGRFRIDDVRPGRYQLGISVNADRKAQGAGARRPIVTARMTVTVPEVAGGRSNEPLDLGTIAARPFVTLEVGGLAPDFALRRIHVKDQGQPLKLSDQRGKLVLILFWATSARSSLADMTALKDIQKTFGGDPRFQLIGLSCDETPEAAERYLEENDLPWVQAFAGNLGSRVSTRYMLRAIPSTFLVGRDGRILAKDLRGAALKGAIARALNSADNGKGGRK